MNEKTRFELSVATWRKIRFACQADGFSKIAESIQNHVEGHSAENKVEIAVPVDCCVGISRACANHNIGAGIAFTTAASSHLVEKVKCKPVTSEALAAAKEELEEMES